MKFKSTRVVALCAVIFGFWPANATPNPALTSSASIRRMLSRSDFSM